MTSDDAEDILDEVNKAEYLIIKTFEKYNIKMEAGLTALCRIMVTSIVVGEKDIEKLFCSLRSLRKTMLEALQEEND